MYSSLVKVDQPLIDKKKVKQGRSFLLEEANLTKKEAVI